MVNKFEDKLDSLFSLYIRLKHSDHTGFCSCYTCEIRKDYREMDAGHFITRGNMSTRWDEDNVKVQCTDCNRIRNGMVESFEEHLRDDLGDEAVDALIQRGREAKQYTDEEYKELINTLKMKIRQKGVII